MQPKEAAVGTFTHRGPFPEDVYSLDWNLAAQQQRKLGNRVSHSHGEPFTHLKLYIEVIWQSWPFRLEPMRVALAQQ